MHPKQSREATRDGTCDAHAINATEKLAMLLQLLVMLLDYRKISVLKLSMLPGSLRCYLRRYLSTRNLQFQALRGLAMLLAMLPEHGKPEFQGTNGNP